MSIKDDWEKRYTVVSEYGRGAFQKQVQELLANDWQLAGGVSSEGGHFFQAMYTEVYLPDQKSPAEPRHKDSL